MNEDTLSHYGVKGMKWGVRKERDRFNANRSLGKSNLSFYQKHQENLFNNYKAKGMSSEQARVAAVGAYATFEYLNNHRRIYRRI